MAEVVERLGSGRQEDLIVHVHVHEQEHVNEHVHEEARSLLGR
jgi:hypothetical protein